MDRRCLRPTLHRTGSILGPGLLLVPATSKATTTNAAALLVPPGSSSNALAAGVDIRGLKPLVPIADPLLWLWWTLAALFVLTGLFLVWRRWRKKQTLLPPIIVIPPAQRAREKLQEALALIEQPRPFCIAVSDAIRFYLEERFEFRAPERTTEEFLHELQSTALLSFEQKQSLGEFLQACDLVKFARYEPGRAELQSMHESALRLVTETEPASPPAAHLPAQPA